MQLLIADRALVGPELTLLESAAVVVGDNGKITWVGPQAEAPVSATDDVVVHDLGDSTILPGLIDAHVHLGFDGGPAPADRMNSEHDAAQVALMLRSARELLSVGVTTARDLGARGYLGVAVREAISSGTARGPRLVVSGPPITVTGGHCWFMGAEADSVDEARKMVRLHHKNGADLIKVMVSGGNMSPGSAPWKAQFDAVMVDAIVSEAHRVGKKVAAHVHGADAIEMALDAGVDTLEHCSFQVEGGSFELDPRIANRIVAAGVYVSPTVSFRLPEMLAFMPETDFPIGELYRRGAKIIASTDAGIEYVVHHGFIGGLAALADFGLPTHEVLVAATSRAAEALGLADTTGQLSAGYGADLIAVAGQPHLDLAALNDLRLVMTGGEVFDPDPLPPTKPLPDDYLPMNLRRRDD